MPNMFEPLDPIGPALNAFNAVQNMASNRTRNALAQMEMQKEKRRQNALQVYGQTRNTEDLWKLDPETAMAAEKYVAGMKAEKRRSLHDDITLFDSMKAQAVNDPDVYKTMYEKGDKEFTQYLMSPDKFAKLTPQERSQELFAKERLAMAIKQAPSWYQQKRIEIDTENQKYKETPEQKEERIQNRPGTVLRFDSRGIPKAFGTRGPTKVANEPAGVTFVDPKAIKPGQTYPRGTRAMPTGKEGDPLWSKALERADTEVRALTKEDSTDRRLRGKTPEEIESYRQELAQKYYNEVKAGPGGGTSKVPKQPQPKPQALTKDQVENYYQQHLKAGDIDPEVLKAKRDELLKQIGQ